MSFKTLVAVGKSKENYVFVLPIDKELDLKKAAKSGLNVTFSINLSYAFSVHKQSANIK